MVKWQTYQPKTALAATKIWTIIPEWWTWGIRWWWLPVDKTISKIWEIWPIHQKFQALGQIQWIFQRIYNPIPYKEIRRWKRHFLTYCKFTPILKESVNNPFWMVASIQGWKLANLWLIQAIISRIICRPKKGMLIDSRGHMLEHSWIRRIYCKIQKVKRGQITWWNNISN